MQFLRFQTTWLDPQWCFFFGEQEASDHLGGFSSTALDDVPSDRSSWSTCRENTGWGNQIWLDGFSIAHHNTYHSTYVGDRVCRVHQQGLTRVRCDPHLCELWYEVMGRAVDTGYTRVCPRNGRMKSDWIQPADMEASCRLDRRTCRINHTYCNFSEEKDTHFLFLPLAVAFFFGSSDWEQIGSPKAGYTPFMSAFTKIVSSQLIPGRFWSDLVFHQLPSAPISSYQLPSASISFHGFFGQGWVESSIPWPPNCWSLWRSTTPWMPVAWLPGGDLLTGMIVSLVSLVSLGIMPKNHQQTFRWVKHFFLPRYI